MTSGIYALIDPLSLLVRYVGMTKNLTTREKRHRKRISCVGELTRNWFADLDCTGADFIFAVLENVEVEMLKRSERWWVAYGRCLGWDLTNMNDGGGGNINPHPATRQRISESNRNRWADPVKRAHNVAALRAVGNTSARKAVQKAQRTGHGSAGKYQHGCRCSKCSQAIYLMRFIGHEEFYQLSRDEKRDLEQQLKTRDRSDKGSGLPCGTVAAYARGCRCQKCRDAVYLRGVLGSVPAVNALSTEERCRLLTERQIRGLGEHGTQKRYSQGCRCYECKVAQRSVNRARGGYGPKILPPCGTFNAFMNNTRWKKQGKAHCGPCEKCIEARRKYERGRSR